MTKNKTARFWQGIQRFFSRSYWQNSFNKFSKLPWKKWLHPKQIPALLEDLVTVLLRLGTIILISLFLLFFARLFRDQGYVLRPFSVPESLENAGLTGEVMARRFADKVGVVKELATSVKEDSLLLSSDGEDLNLAVLGVGLSLKSLAYQARETLGRPNKTIDADIVKMDGQYELQLRITGLPDIRKEVAIDSLGNLTALDDLLYEGAEDVLLYTDPYRHAILCYRDKRYDQALKSAKYLLREKPAEAHWGYVAWGICLQEQGELEEAEQRFEQAVNVKEDFTVGWTRLRMIRMELDDDEGAREAALRLIAIDPTDAYSYLSYAWTLHGQGAYELSDSVFAEAVELTTNPDARLNVAMSWAESRLQIDSLEEARELVRLYGSDDQRESAKSYILKGILAFTDRDTITAANYVFEALKIDPTSQMSISTTLTLNFSVGRYNKVIEAFKMSDFTDVYYTQKVFLYNLVATTYYHLNEAHKSTPLVRKAMSVDPSLPYPYATIGGIHFGANQLDSCWYYMEKAFELGFNLVEDTQYYEFPNQSEIVAYPEMQALLQANGQTNAVVDIR